MSLGQWPVHFPPEQDKPRRVNGMPEIPEGMCMRCYAASPDPLCDVCMRFLEKQRGVR